MNEGSSRRSGSGVFSLMGFGRKTDSLQLELHLHQIDPVRGNHLYIQVAFRPQLASQLNDSTWRERCTATFIDLRGYLMAT
jgi:serine/threonine-protein kinase